MRFAWLVGVLLFAASAQANGRMPGANDLVFNAAEPARIVSRATFGIVQSDDRGASWSWICEQAIDVSGVVADPPLGVMQDGTMVLLPPTGSALISHDRGCSWTRAGAPLAGTRGADLTSDPSDAKRMLVLTSTLSAVDDAGFGSYQNLLVETLDDSASFHVLATLPDDFEAETVEVARSDAKRIYISGTDAVDPRLGVVLRSEDGGQTFSKATLTLPAGTGSIWISGIHPSDPDRLWARVSARGDTLGLLPARLYASNDKGETFQQLASTVHGMFGFALSPDGASLAYGGPSDGLFVGPADGRTTFTKRSNLGVSCLRWQDDGSLYACGTEPSDAFSVGVSTDQGVSFRALYSLRDTCPAACATGTSFADSCQSAWLQTGPFISATGDMCSVPWAELDAGQPAFSALDASAPVAPVLLDASRPLDASADPVPASSGDGCSCAVAGSPTRAGRAIDLSFLFAALWLFARRRAGGRA